MYRYVDSDATYKCTPGHFVPNHFVPLLRKHSVDDHETETITIDDNIDSVETNDNDDLSTDMNFQSHANNITDECALTRDPDDDNIIDECTPTCDSDDDLCPFLETTNIHPLSNGCLHDSFVDADEPVRLLSSFSISESHEVIPNGEKNDVYFLI